MVKTDEDKHGLQKTKAPSTRILIFFNLWRHNLVPRASFPLTSGRKTRALGATISGMRHRCRCAVSRITRIRLFPLFFHNGCSQSSCFPTAGQGERSSGNEIDGDRAEKRLRMRHLWAVGGSSAGKSRLEQQISNVKSIAER